jgi:hypothetical protein
MLSDFKNKSVRNTLNFKSIENWRKGSFKLYVYDGTNNLRNLSVSNFSAEATCKRNRLTLLRDFVLTGCDEF